MEFQEALNRAVLGIVKQGRLATNGFGTGFYQMWKNGPRCAIGHLLDEDQLAEIKKSDLSDAPVSTLVDRGILDESFLRPFFRELQSTHDSARDLNDFLAKAKTLADLYDLTFPEVGGQEERVR